MPQHYSLTKTGLFVLLLYGCAQQPIPPTGSSQSSITADTPKLDTDAEILPAVSLFRLNMPDNLRLSCESYQASSPRHRCVQNPLVYDRLAQALEQTQQFETVALADDNNAYSLVIASIARKPPGEAVLYTDVIADVYWFDQKLRQFSYQLSLPSSEDLTATLRYSANPTLATLYNNIAAHLVKDLQDEAVFSKETLHAALQSSRYQQELKAAANIGAFRYKGMHVLHNPAFGASMRYEHMQYGGAYLDVFVYPILDWRYTEPERISEEIQSLRRDLQDLGDQGLWQTLQLNSTQELRGADAQTNIMSFDGEYRNSAGELLATTAHIYRQGDKFVKVRASYPKFAPVRDTVEAFVRDLPHSLQVPPESPFMQKLRAGWRLAGAD